ncbi:MULTISPECIES: phosphate signaling complex PhoU family protein [Mycolicibacterium]|uniref:Phosphate uptake regulator, PhoU n=2 Tax=Mycolicibacterium TaxID=1866885 RepID=A1TA05_MYCVP|nr:MULTISPECIES: phosphate uptake regulator PhoU [Mycolicibacterium]ABM14005.1 phosphate uptake regulator, PhoU [Mycolicibacterium vanbaalenii PYR-1]MDN4517034.1 phosphate uptake regulator PhoU [Mycolicibacterium austroafricanum]QRZ04412.1 phosphate uptake regulator PhoU [Mycolicibacterium austroafricanum]QZT54543.1 phosphate uptake regulator PhoU [Mycolicibacterium austroafricanum]QZT66153.1 phosphate uptake regulator PhoU [Mycolicibacterium austroafricanum]
MRTEFHQALDRLTVDLAEMCGRAAALMQAASAALLEADIRRADTVAFDLKRLTRLGNAVHDRAYCLLALQAPVARDLRVVVSALYIAADADRMGGLASNVARAARRRDPDRVVPHDVHDLFAGMAATAIELAGLAQSTVRTGDPALAWRVCDGDEQMNELHRQLFSRLMGPRWRHGPTVAADLVLVGRFYERFADHAVEIARRVHFQATGTQLRGSGDGPGIAAQNPSAHPALR